MTELDEIINAIKNFPGVTRKNGIKDVTDRLSLENFPEVHASAGEDAAAIEMGENYLLFAADGMMESLVEADPFYAGYFAVLVNVNDIAAMGGKPIGMVDVLSVKDKKIFSEIMRGINYGIEKFNVPIVGGHTHPDSKYHAIDVAITGVVPKENIILSSGAKEGDDIVLVMDLEGKFPEKLPYAWETTTARDEKTVRAQMDAMCEIGKRKLAHSAKDISNPGSVGTTGMMLEASGKGGIVDIEKIPIPKNVDLIQWLLAYQGCGFTFACKPKYSSEIISIFEKVGCDGAVVGKVDGTGKMKLRYKGKEKILFDFEKEIITGCNKKLC